MTALTINTTTDDNGGIHVDVAASTFPPRVPVEVTVRPASPVLRYGLRVADLTPFYGTVAIEEDPLATQRRMREEWPE